MPIEKTSAPNSRDFNAIGEVLVSKMSVTPAGMKELAARFPEHHIASWLEVVAWACKNYEARVTLINRQVLTADVDLMLSGPLKLKSGLLERISKKPWELLTKREQSEALAEFDTLPTYEKVWASPGKGPVRVSINAKGDGRMEIYTATSVAVPGLVVLISDKAPAGAGFNPVTTVL